MLRFIFIILAMLATTHSSTPQPKPDTSIKPSKRIAFTFDDAPRGQGAIWSGEERATALISSLEKAGIEQVAFFVTTRGLETEEGRKRIEAYANAGHLIANHSHTHKWAIRTEVADYLADIDVAEAELNKLRLANRTRRAWFRFPFLDEGTPLEKRDALRAGLAERGLFNGYVTVDNYDWHIANLWRRAVQDGRRVDLDILQAAYIEILLGAIEFYDGAALEHLGVSPPHVLLLHENDTSAMFIDDLAAALRAKGWDIISPEEAYADKFAQTLPQTLRTRQGHLAALAIEAGADPKSFDHLAINEDQIEALLEARGAFGRAAKED